MNARASGEPAGCGGLGGWWNEKQGNGGKERVTVDGGCLGLGGEMWDEGKGKNACCLCDGGPIVPLQCPPPIVTAEHGLVDAYTRCEIERETYRQERRRLPADATRPHRGSKGGPLRVRPDARGLCTCRIHPAGWLGGWVRLLSFIHLSSLSLVCPSLCPCSPPPFFPYSSLLSSLFSPPFYTPRPPLHNTPPHSFTHSQSSFFDVSTSLPARCVAETWASHDTGRRTGPCREARVAAQPTLARSAPQPSLIRRRRRTTDAPPLVPKPCTC